MLQGVPNNLTCFLNRPLQILENKVISLSPNNPWETASRKEPDATEPTKCIAQRLIKMTLHHGKGLPRAEIPLLGKELPNDVSSVSPPVLSQRTIVKFVFY